MPHRAAVSHHSSGQRAPKIPDAIHLIVWVPKEETKWIIQQQQAHQDKHWESTSDPSSGGKKKKGGHFCIVCLSVPLISAVRVRYMFVCECVCEYVCVSVWVRVCVCLCVSLCVRVFGMGSTRSFTSWIRVVWENICLTARPACSFRQERKNGRKWKCWKEKGWGRGSRMCHVCDLACVRLFELLYQAKRAGVCICEGLCVPVCLSVCSASNLSE